MWAIRVGVVLVGLTGTAVADNWKGFITGVALLENCRKSGPRAAASCDGYITGTIDGLLAADQTLVKCLAGPPTFDAMKKTIIDALAFDSRNERIFAPMSAARVISGILKAEYCS